MTEVPFTVTAHLINGFVAGDPWSPAIDGILGYAYFVEKVGFETATYNATETSMLETPADLPLKKIRHGDTWWYACSSPIADEKLGVVGREKKHFHGRFDDFFAAVDLLPSTGKVMTAAGQYKNNRKSEIRVITPSIHWHCIGDPDECLRLLQTLHEPQVGGGRARGYGSVSRWKITPGDEDTAQLATAHRPVPIDYAAEHGIAGPSMIHGYRTPARAPGNKTLCVMPARLA